jgi:hypothetical protein
MKLKKKEIYHPCIMIIGNLSSDKDLTITERLINENVLTVLLEILDSQIGSKVINDIIWVISNLSDSNLKVVMHLTNNDKLNISMLYILENYIDNQVNCYNLVKIQNMFNIPLPYQSWK